MEKVFVFLIRWRAVDNLDEPCLLGRDRIREQIRGGILFESRFPPHFDYVLPINQCHPLFFQSFRRHEWISPYRLLPACVASLPLLQLSCFALLLLLRFPFSSSLRHQQFLCRSFLDLPYPPSS